MSAVDETHAPKLHTRIRVGIEGEQAVVSTRDEHHVVHGAVDGEIRGPKGLGIDRAVGDAGKELAEAPGADAAAGSTAAGRQGVFLRVDAVARETSLRYVKTPARPVTPSAMVLLTASGS